MAYLLISTQKLIIFVLNSFKCYRVVS